MGGFFSTGIDIDIKDTDIGMLPETDNSVRCVIDLFKRYKGRIVIVTGAGISAHQLPTFRSNNNSGLWEAFSPPILAKNYFYENPKPSWKLLSNIRNLQVSNILHPSLAHHVIHYLIEKEFVSKVITQNIDGLHGFQNDVSSNANQNKVVELHGAVSDYGICEKCHQKKPVDNLAILQSGECPTCDYCHSILKPPVAFFGDVIDKDKRAEASIAIMQCDVLVLVGTHCTVDPVLSMASEAKRNGSILVEINLTPTPADGLVNVQLQGTADSIFKEIGQELVPDVDFNNLVLEKWSKA
ncbi:NAD-dependent protein deacetylase [Tritrichomonas foetus]|uniref:NAD-dependent protein deacetylase n=1 Tax=Tritrichomonas foetus TaxID=1144522 RepID=A0A1J4JGI5_9EUKA|nr:NAD-dependent protein deacetylase [Tritrichomonas foetus]|eukprot:OHS96755.1 NAD-dependent protein deacetylase [Tritrichomonas foetus]